MAKKNTLLSRNAGDEKNIFLLFEEKKLLICTNKFMRYYIDVTYYILMDVTRISLSTVSFLAQLDLEFPAYRMLFFDL